MRPVSDIFRQYPPAWLVIAPAVRIPLDCREKGFVFNWLH